MALHETTPEERIILATIGCIEKEGIDRLTVRSIAKEAGVNSAAINYYFRSKDRLLAKVMETTLDHLFEDLEAILNDESLDPPTRVSEMLDYLIDGATRYPGVTRAHFHRAISAPAPEDPFTRRMNLVLGRLRERIGEKPGSSSGRQGERALDLALVAMFSAAILPAVLPSFYSEFSGVDFRDSQTRKGYVRAIASRFDLEHLLDG